METSEHKSFENYLELKILNASPQCISQCVAYSIRQQEIRLALPLRKIRWAFNMSYSTCMQMRADKCKLPAPHQWAVDPSQLETFQPSKGCYSRIAQVLTRTAAQIHFDIPLGFIFNIHTYFFVPNHTEFFYIFMIVN